MYVHIHDIHTVYIMLNVDQGIGVKIFFIKNKINKLLLLYNTCTTSYKYNNIYLFYIHVCIQRVLHTYIYIHFDTVVLNTNSHKLYFL